MGWETHMVLAEVSEAHELTSPDTPVLYNHLRHPTIPTVSVLYQCP